jgi:YHS domain-containing protein
MDIDADSAAASVEFQGKTYYFCSDRCRGMFVAHPDRYVPVEDEGDAGRSAPPPPSLTSTAVAGRSGRDVREHS